MTLSEKAKSIFDLVRAVASYLAIIAFAFYITFKTKIDNIDWSNISSLTEMLLYFLATLLVIFPILAYYSENIKLRWIIFRGNLKQFVIEKSELTIDIYHKDGKYADIYQKTFFHKVNSNTKEHFISSIDVSGEIVASSVQTLNCYQSLNHEKNNISISYTNDMKKLNTLINYFKKNDKFLMYYMTLKNSFTNTEEESWDMFVNNLCQDYYVEIILPPNKKVKYARFIRNNKSKEVVDKIQPIIIRHENRMKIILRVMNFDKNESFKLVWSLS